ncbi:hypothetical protein Daesc_006587 [Daldinia eschscholtzii]|uniref:C2H2-type domain-containing protein n=1 Tax=Daldinia eschscholtzii TaxID=292717 RepID=A0AAX6MH81_9PEZI
MMPNPTVTNDEISLSPLETRRQSLKAESTFGIDSNTSDNKKYEQVRGQNSIKSVTADLFPLNDAPFSQSSGSKQHKLGLDINYPLGWTGSAYNDYDVVTVHGIRDDYKTAWIDKTGTWWVKDQLFKDLSIREVDYSYEIDEDSAIYEPNGILHHAEKLIKKYAEVRKELDETEVDRPIFLGTPHRFESQDDLEDQLHKLIRLPGPEIRNMVPNKVKVLAQQVDRINQSFLATKMLDRAVIINHFTHNTYDSLREAGLANGDVDDTHLTDEDEYNFSFPVTPFSRYSHFIGHSFEAFGRISCRIVDHADFIKGDPNKVWLFLISKLFNVSGSSINVGYRITRFQAQLLSLAPPTRALDTPFDPALPIPLIVKWIYKQESFINFTKSDIGYRILHLHGNGNSLVDILEISRIFHIHYGSEILIGRDRRRAEKTIMYFEFDRWDSRYNSISAMLTQFIHILFWRFWDNGPGIIVNELSFLNDAGAWSLEDLYYLFTTFRDHVQITHQLTFFVSSFDQCPENERQWFLNNLLEEQTYTEAQYRIIISTSTREDLNIEKFVNKSHINVENFPSIGELGNKLAEDLRMRLVDLIRRRPIYEDYLPQLRDLLNECGDKSYLGRIVLAWLGNSPRRKPEPNIANKINRLYPLTAENIVRVFIDSLEPLLQSRARNAFNWIKHAAEPWSPESLVQALMVHELHGEDSHFGDLDTGGVMSDIEEAFAGIITVTDRNVRFSHPSFYHAPDVGVEGSVDERAARINSALAGTCLLYIQLESAQEVLSSFSPENLEGGPWETLLDATVMSFPRTSMAEYAIRFWPRHYRASGKFKPAKLVQELFSSERARASWEIAFWLFSNPITRMTRSYISTLPVFTMLGLDDLVDEQIKLESSQQYFQKNCWFAITEAARTGNAKLIQKLLAQVTVDEEELQQALFWAAANTNTDIIDSLIGKIPNVKCFDWPKNLIFRAAAAGLDGLLATMLMSGCDINEISDIGKTPLSMFAIRRNRVSTLELLLNSNPQVDLTIGDENETQMTRAAKMGNPRVIELLLRSGASTEATNYWDQKPARAAVEYCKHRALDVLLKGRTYIENDVTLGGSLDGKSYRRPLLITAASMGLQECVRILLNHGFDIDEIHPEGTALYAAIEAGHANVAKILLEHDPKPNKDAAPPGGLAPLTKAVCSENADLVSLLLECGAQVNIVEFCEEFYRTPLSWACAKGNLDIVKLLLANKADINYTGGFYTPLFTALWHDHIEVISFLLQNEDIDVTWVSHVGLGHLYVACSHPILIRELLKRGASVDGHGSSVTVLHQATRYGFPRSIEVLLENDPKLDLDHFCGYDGTSEDLVGNTPLQLACIHHKPKCVEVLLKAGANPNLKNTNGNDAVDILLLRTESDSEDAVECLKLLMSRIYNVPIDYINAQGQTRLHAIQKKTPLSLVQFLVELRTSLDFQDQYGYTPLASAVEKSNVDVARYLIEQGANINLLSPNFGSILHLAVRNSTLDTVKLLVNSGADLEAVHPEYGQSLLYTALDAFQEESRTLAMVQYLVNEAKAPIDKLGGELGYPIIRAAELSRTHDAIGISIKIVKFLIQRKAQLNVPDSQGRRAIHFACMAWTNDCLEALAEAGADVNVKDKFGRMPVHFAAGSPNVQCLKYLLENFSDIDINAVDHDNWTPLMWAARSGFPTTVTELLSRKADVWARGRAYGMSDEWSALKIVQFSNNIAVPTAMLQPEVRTRINQQGEKEEWDDSQHISSPGHLKLTRCKSCLIHIIGIQWKCINCSHDFSLCFKCYSHRSDIHNREHNFEEIGPLYFPGLTEDPTNEDVNELLPEESILGGEEQGDTSDNIEW